MTNLFYFHQLVCAQISLVCYFALPPDLRTRFPCEPTERFLALFDEFSRLPSSEEERRALWD